MERTPTISVLMSVYNGERYLAAAMDSILAQTFTDFELIVIDDGSNDSSGVRQARPAREAHAPREQGPDRHAERGLRPIPRQISRANGLRRRRPPPPLRRTSRAARRQPRRGADGG